jgi:hypothetical protein
MCVLTLCLHHTHGCRATSWLGRALAALDSQLPSSLSCDDDVIAYTAYAAKFRVLVQRTVVDQIPQWLLHNGTGAWHPKTFLGNLYETHDTSGVNASAILEAFGQAQPAAPRSINVSLAGAGSLTNCTGYWVNIYTLEMFDLLVNEQGVATVPHPGTADVSSHFPVQPQFPEITMQLR